MIKHTLHTFGSHAQARRALQFVASFPGNGGQKCFGIENDPISGFPTVFFAEEHKTNFGMTPEAMSGALRAWARLMRKRG